MATGGQRVMWCGYWPISRQHGDVMPSSSHGKNAPWNPSIQCVCVCFAHFSEDPALHQGIAAQESSSHLSAALTVSAAPSLIVQTVVSWTFGPEGGRVHAGTVPSSKGQYTSTKHSHYLVLSFKLHFRLYSWQLLFSSCLGQSALKTLQCQLLILLLGLLVTFLLFRLGRDREPCDPQHWSYDKSQKVHDTSPCDPCSGHVTISTEHKTDIPGQFLSCLDLLLNCWTCWLSSFSISFFLLLFNCSNSISSCFSNSCGGQKICSHTILVINWISLSLLTRKHNRVDTMWLTSFSPSNFFSWMSFSTLMRA